MWPAGLIASIASGVPTHPDNSPNLRKSAPSADQTLLCGFCDLVAKPSFFVMSVLLVVKPSFSWFWCLSWLTILKPCGEAPCQCHRGGLKTIQRAVLMVFYSTFAHACYRHERNLSPPTLSKWRMLAVMRVRSKARQCPAIKESKSPMRSP